MADPGCATYELQVLLSRNKSYTETHGSGRSDPYLGTYGDMAGPVECTHLNLQALLLREVSIPDREPKLLSYWALYIIVLTLEIRRIGQSR